MERETKQLINSRHESDGQQAAHTAASGPDRKADATIAKDVIASGKLCGAGTVLVEGTVIGGIKLDGGVTVAESGVVRGPIRADTVYVSGCVEGDIEAKTCLRLEMTGSITGDVTMPSFIIADGGYFNGRSHMTKSGAEPIILY